VENELTDTSVNPEPRKPKRERATVDDCYKFLSWCVRKIIYLVTDSELGDNTVDKKVGDALSSIVPAKDICDMGLEHSIGVNAAAGAWHAVKEE